MRFYYKREETEIGPFEQEQLRLLLPPQPDQLEALRAEEDTDWSPAAQYLERWSAEPVATQIDPRAWNLTVQVASEVVRQAGWLMVPVNEPVLALISGAHLLVLLPRTSITAEQVERDMEEWHQRLVANEWEAAQTLDLVYCLPEPASDSLQSLRRQRKASFRGRSVRADFADPSLDASSVASLDKEVSTAIKTGVRRFQAGETVSGRQLIGELFASGHTHNKMKRRLARVKPRATMAILTVCLLMFGAGEMAGGTESGLNLLRLGANYYPLTVGQGEWWRLTACTFLHIGLLHLACNLLTLLSVGSRAEQIYGSQRYLGLYAFSGLAGSLASVLTGETVSAGASGALFGVCGAVMVMGRRYHAQWPPAFRRGMFQGMAPMIGYNLIYGFSQAGIDNSAHLGGLLAGAVYAMLVRPQALDDHPTVTSLDKGLLLVGLLPFLAQAIAVHNAIERKTLGDYPRQSYADPSGDLEVSMPAIFVPKVVSGETFFQGPGLAVTLTKLDDLKAVALSSPQFLEALKQAGSATIASENLAGRTWVLRDTSEGSVRVRQAFAYLGTMAVKIEVDCTDSDRKVANELRLLLIENIHRKNYDTLSQGMALAKLGFHERALEELALVPSPTRESQVQTAASLIALARYKEAGEQLDKLEKAYPEEASVWTQRATLCEKRKDYAGAWAAYQKASKLEKDPQEKFHAMVDGAGLLEMLDRGPEAAAMYNQARAGYLDKGHIESDIYNEKAWNLIQRGRFREALPLAERAVQAEENNATLDTRGRAFLELGQFEKAKADYEKILQSDINKPDANYAIACLLDKAGDKANARNFYFRYLALAGSESEFSKQAKARVKELGKEK